MSKRFSIVKDFRGYRAREDITNMGIGFLVRGSRDVLTNSANRVGTRQGYTLDGQANAALTPIQSSYDWNMHIGQERNIRSFGTVLQYRFVDSNNVVTWRDLATGFATTAVDFNFTEFWDTVEISDCLLFVNGTSNIFEWSGGLTTIASNTAVTLTKQGTTSWAEEGFYIAKAARAVTVNGVSYTYTGGEATVTLTGLVGLPAFVAGTVAHQTMVTTANAAMTAIPAVFANDLISSLYNQVYVGSRVSREVYVSQVNSYINYSFAVPRIVGTGALLTLDGAVVGFVPQEDQMYITAGKGQWYQTKFTLGGTLTIESLTISRLKTTPDSAARTQGYIEKIDNKISFISNEPSFNLLGRVDNIFAAPDTENISDVIRDDMNTYDFSSNLGDIVFWKNFTYISVPLENIVLVYNNDKKWWEAPQTLPIGKFSIIDGELYGHSSAVAETYKLFTGYNDNAAPILSQAVFSYQNYGTRPNLKSFNEFYVEGYIAGNTTLTVGVKYEIDGCATETFMDIDGSDTQIVCIPSTDNSLGKNPLGSFPLGTLFFGPTSLTLPPKFRVIKTFPRKDFFEVQYSFSSFGADQQWELLGFGPQVSLSKNDSVYIKQ